jgi:hypothetical protein
VTVQILHHCIVCERDLPLDAFYQHPRGRHGVQSKCKPCMRVYMRALRLKRREHYRKYDADRYALAKRYPNRDEKKRKATAMVNIRVQRGTMRKPANCSKCGSGERLEAHHTDYDKPLQVVWLCRLCHADAHAIEKLRP